MTTVAWDGKSLAADRRMAGWMDAGKIFKLKDGRVLAGAGWLDEIIEVAAWLDNGGDERDKPTVDAEDDESATDYLLIDGDKCYWLTAPYLRPVEVLDGMAAVGSGAKFALGAMEAGKTAAEAVVIASKFDPHTGGGVDVYPETARKRR
jgi:ATP-dependent protease HslVU (ClpYQ) peptidase subunit